MNSINRAIISVLWMNPMITFILISATHWVFLTGKLYLAKIKELNNYCICFLFTAVVLLQYVFSHKYQSWKGKTVTQSLWGREVWKKNLWFQFVLKKAFIFSVPVSFPWFCPLLLSSCLFSIQLISGISFPDVSGSLWFSNTHSDPEHICLHFWIGLWSSPPRLVSHFMMFPWPL